jgi:hypothetical protein
MHELSYLDRIKLIINYDTMIINLVQREWQPYLVTFMFRQMPKRKSTKITIMTDEVTSAYSTLLTHVVRRPNSPSWCEWKPVFIGCPDLPVPKGQKIDGYATIANDGWHFNGCLVLPPDDKCRLKQHLHDHFQQNRKFYIKADNHLERIHATAMDKYIIADYVMKHFKRGNISSDDILLLPRAQTEMPSR